MATPKNARRVLGATTKGLIVSDDCGRTWREMEGWSHGEATSVCVLSPPSRDRAVYLAAARSGVFRSEDRGKTWSYAARGCPWANTFYEIAFDPYVPKKMYAACSRRHDIPGWNHVAPNAEVGASAKGGVCVSTDQGRTWSVLGAGLPELPCTSIVIDPKSPKGNLTMYTVLFEGGVYKSTDNGQTWVKKSNGLGRPGNMHTYKVKIHPKTGDLYCLVTANRHGLNFPVPGGPTKHKIVLRLFSGDSLRTAMYSTMRSFTFSSP